MTTFHVATTGSDRAAGTREAPLRTIGRAAELALPGDTVLVHAGVYREWVRPRHAGLSDTRRITYAAAPGEHVAIKGSERVRTWQHEQGQVWRAELPNAMFGDWNPYALEVDGDWLVPTSHDEPRKHLGEVYLDGVSLYEVGSRAEVDAPPRRESVLDRWTTRQVPVEDPDRTQLVWYAEVGPEVTTIWANVGAADPNEALVEVNVRRSVFYPTEHGIDYITVRGFELAHAACPWTPPTADQPGLIGPNWAKGWVIEHNDIHDAKCSAVSLGKEAQSGDNYFTKRRDKPGYQYQLEAVFAARHLGWAKERIGSHVVRHNHIHDCGQNGVVGHLGCVFSEIHDNEIHHIATKREFFGHEIGGIKLHAAIDVVIRRNHIHDCTLGTWLDWQTQGTRVSANVFHHNTRDLFIEVSHGPYVVDHNILASPASIETMSQGGAYLGNLVGGTLRFQTVLDRATPYHEPHSCEVAGYAVVHGADERFWGNVFVGNGGDPSDVTAAYGPAGHAIDPAITKVGYGTFVYDGHPASLEEFIDAVKAQLPGDLNIFKATKQPVLVRGNVYLRGARPYEREDDPLVLDADPAVAVTVGGDGGVVLALELPEEFGAHLVPVATTADLGRARFPDCDFDDPSGRPTRFGTDLLGADKGEAAVAGPVASLRPGYQEVEVWRPSAG